MKVKAPTAEEAAAAKARASDGLSDIDAALARNKQAVAEEKVRAAETERDREVWAIRSARANAANNAAGAAYLQSLSQMELAAVSRHAIGIESARREHDAPKAAVPPAADPAR